MKNAVEQCKRAASDPQVPIHGITADFASLDEVRASLKKPHRSSRMWESVYDVT